MSKPLTNAGRIALREATYHLPEKRCETCRHSNRSSDLCFLNRPGGRHDIKHTVPIDPAGLCDVWEPRP